MTKMRVEELIEELREVIGDAKNMPFSGGKVIVEADHVKDILDDIDDNLPQEVRQAKAIVADRAQIIADAKKEAEQIIRNAEERKKTLVNQNEIVRQAQAEANDIINDAQAKSKELRKAANAYIDDLMARTDELLSAQVNELKKARAGLKNTQRSGN